MSKPISLSLPFDEPEPAGNEAGPLSPDAADRAAAVDPRLNVVLEASAGTGKTRVLVDRYTNLIRAGVDPRHILAITFTRKAAAEMRERILVNLRRAAEEGGIDPARWRQLRERLGDVAISTIDAFCLSLLGEFPLEADLDPGFGMADETEAARLVDESLDRSMRIARSLATEDPAVGLVLTSLGDFQVRAGLASLIDRRLAVGDALTRAMRVVPENLTAATASLALFERIHRTFAGVGLSAFIRTGPARHPRFRLLAADLARLASGTPPAEQDGFRNARLLADAIRAYFFTKDNTPRKRSAYVKDHFPGEVARKTHQQMVESLASSLAEDLNAFRRDLNAVLTRGTWRLFAIARKEYRQTLDEHAVVDFPEALARALELLGAMGEFTASRFQLESRYQHLLLDEFQDTSDAQWRLVWQLVQSWREGLGVAQDQPLEPTIFVVGDRKQSIYGFRDADVGVLRRAAGRIAELRPDGAPVRRAIRQSFRAVPPLLAFTNALCDAITTAPAVSVGGASRSDAFTYEDVDRFPIDLSHPWSGDPALGLVATTDAVDSARAVAAEIARLLAEGIVRDRQTGVARPVRPGDIAILFRSREGHQQFESSLEAEGIPSYVYKGLGFFDTDEVKDVVAVLRWLGDPSSSLRAAAFLRSRLVRLSDRALSVLAPDLAAAVTATVEGDSRVDADDAAVLAEVRAFARGWILLADRLPPAELLDQVLEESAYNYELAGPRAVQAQENLKKIRALVRRIQNRGYATLARVTEHLDRLSAGDESNAAIDAVNAVNLMTIHAAKGLEFPVVFLVNLHKGAGGGRDPIRLTGVTEDDTPSVAIGDFRSEADDDAADREREETKRLLYVAVTRARDRLYLASVLGREGAFIAARGGVGEVLPMDLREVFTRAVSSHGDVIEWTSGGVHRFVICGAASGAKAPPPQGLAATGPQAAPPQVVDFGKLGPAAGVERVSVTGESWSSDVTNLAATPELKLAPTKITETLEGRLVGILLHRLIEHLGLAPHDRDRLATTAESLLRRDERLAASDLMHVVDAVVSRYQDLAARPDLAGLFQSARVWHEVPVALRDGDRVVHGAIDSLIVGKGRAWVLEFKSGRPDPSHERQVARYVEAVRRLLPGVEVQARLVYARDSAREGV
jgi:ATP-dependent helicase/nuclease subunit A